MRLSYGLRSRSGSLAMLAAIRRAWALILSAYPAAFAIIIPERGRLSGRKAMEWFKRKTSIVGYQISNWIIVLGAIIIVLLIFQNSH
jgi:hypothetical protein